MPADTGFVLQLHTMQYLQTCCRFAQTCCRFFQSCNSRMTDNVGPGKSTATKHLLHAARAPYRVPHCRCTAYRLAAAPQLESFPSPKQERARGSCSSPTSVSVQQRHQNGLGGCPCTSCSCSLLARQAETMVPSTPVKMARCCSSSLC